MGHRKDRQSGCRHVMLMRMHVAICVIGLLVVFDGSLVSCDSSQLPQCLTT